MTYPEHDREFSSKAESSPNPPSQSELRPYVTPTLQKIDSSTTRSSSGLAVDASMSSS